MCVVCHVIVCLLLRVFWCALSCSCFLLYVCSSLCFLFGVCLCCFVFVLLSSWCIMFRLVVRVYRVLVLVWIPCFVVFVTVVFVVCSCVSCPSLFHAHVCFIRISMIVFWRVRSIMISPFVVCPCVYGVCYLVYCPLCVLFCISLCCLAVFPSLRSVSLAVLGCLCSSLYYFRFPCHGFLSSCQCFRLC